MQGKAYVAGVGSVPFGKPGTTEPYDKMSLLQNSPCTTCCAAAFALGERFVWYERSRCPSC